MFHITQLAIVYRKPQDYNLTLNNKKFYAIINQP